MKSISLVNVTFSNNCRDLVLKERLTSKQVTAVELSESPVKIEELANASIVICKYF